LTIVLIVGVIIRRTRLSIRQVRVPVGGVSSVNVKTFARMVCNGQSYGGL
jgi:hypothetical protein